MAEQVADEKKYITFKRSDLLMVSDGFVTFKVETELEDAVVIRRQDQFASPCLLTYALMISMVADNHPDDRVGRELRVIADYFHDQGVLAGDEAFKLPDL